MHKKLILFSILGLFFPVFVFAQGTLFVSPSSGAYEIGQQFSALINVNTGGQPINAASAQINFDNQRLDVVSVGYSQSIFNIWTEEPKFSNAAGTISFSGGIPNPGFVGASGAIVRITFKTKAQGQAPIVFVSGSVLANDGRGTNILDTLKGGIYNVVAGGAKFQEQKKPTQEPPSSIVSERPVDIPIITDYPKSIEEGTALTVRGLGFPNARILVSVQKGSADPVVEEVFSGADGRFSFTHSKSVESGFYRIWAKNVALSGNVSAPSEAVVIEVTKPLFFRIGSIAFNYASIIVTLIALIVLGLIIIFWMLMRFKKWQKSQGKEIHEAEEAVHKGFDALKTGLRKYIRYLSEGKTEKGIKRREGGTEEKLEEELEDIEKGIEKEIEDIKNPKKK